MEELQISSLALYAWTQINFRNNIQEKGMVYGNTDLSGEREALRRIQQWCPLNLDDEYIGVISLCAFLYVWHILQINKILVPYLTSLKKYQSS